MYLVYFDLFESFENCLLSAYTQQVKKGKVLVFADFTYGFVTQDTENGW